MKTVSVNVNSYVFVKLTDEGRRVLQEHRDWLLAICPPTLSEHCGLFYRERDDGTTRFQLWALFELFGRHVSQAGPLMFETTIQVEVDG